MMYTSPEIKKISLDLEDFIMASTDIPTTDKEMGGGSNETTIVPMGQAIANYIVD